MQANSYDIAEKVFDTIIVGGGLGGLQCGYILSKAGMNVAVVEKNHLAGGALQSYRRRSKDGVFHEFDSGMHYVGALDEGQPLNVLFRYFNLMELPWCKMDPEAFDEVIINGKSYLFANGHDNFIEQISSYFPKERENIRRYVSLLKSVGESLPKSLSPRDADGTYTQSLFARSAFEFLNETIGDPLLREVLSGTSLKMELTPTLPLYTFAQINNSFIESSYRLQGGGNLVAESLIKSIRKMGGTVLLNSEVTEISSKGVKIGEGINLYSKYIISNLHPARTMELVSPEAGLRKVYKNRIARLENTFGMFTANIALKEESIGYLNRNQYLHTVGEGDSLWHRYEKENNGDSLLISYYNIPQEDGKPGKYAKRLDLLAPMHWSEVAGFEGTKVGKRGEEYENLKEQKCKELVDRAKEVIPGLEENIVQIYTSTPLTYSDYTATGCGSAYGIRKDCTNLMQTLLTPKTPLENLYLTGQNLNLHGVLGVSMTSFFTCAHIIGMENAVKDLKFDI